MDFAREMWIQLYNGIILACIIRDLAGENQFNVKASDSRYNKEYWRLLWRDIQRDIDLIEYSTYAWCIIEIVLRIRNFFEFSE